MPILNQKNKFFTENLMKWHMQNNNRIMPWSKEPDTYKIWISEILLQQTRVEQATDYYIKFISNFPTLSSLAMAQDEVVFKNWEGLGYYSRCRNLIATARKICFELNGVFPNTYEGLLSLKGIGPYTAAAIASFAYGLPHAVLDGNVYRVLARFFGNATPIDSVEGSKQFRALAHNLLYKKDPGAFNQAIMDFGATVCKPQIANCSVCFLQKQCEAYKNGLVNQLPVKEKVLKRKKRNFTYFIFRCNGKILIHERQNKDIWQNLFEFFLFESSKPLEWSRMEIEKWVNEQIGIKNYTIKNLSSVYHQKLTHQDIAAKFILIDINESIPVALSHFKVCDDEALKSVAFPQIINQFLATTEII